MVAFLRSARKAAPRLAALAAVTFLASCQIGGLSNDNTGPEIDRSKPVPVALLVPKSAPGGAAALAGDLERAARLAISELDGVEVDLRVYDSGAGAGAASAMAQKAVDQGATLILGPLFADSAAAAGVAVADEGVQVLSFSNNTTVAGRNVFVIGNTFESVASRLVPFARNRDKGRILVVNGADTAERQGAQAIKTAIAQNGATLAGQEEFAMNPAGVQAALPKIKAKVAASGAQSLFFTSGTTGALPVLLELLPGQQLGPDMLQYIGLQRLDLPIEARKLAGIQGAWFAIPDPAINQQFQARYKAKYGADPHPLAGLAYDAVNAAGVVAKSSDRMSPKSLTRSSGFAGVNGAFRLLPNGHNQRALAVATIRDGAVVIVDGAPRGFGGFGM